MTNRDPQMGTKMIVCGDIIPALLDADSVFAVSWVSYRRENAGRFNGPDADDTGCGYEVYELFWQLAAYLAVSS
jgi:hypothetical protein